MPLNREEIAADLIWRYVEHLRQSRGDDTNVALSAAELAQLVETMALAGDLPHALATEATTDARKAAVLRRLEAAVSTPAAAPQAEPRPIPSRPWYAGLLAGAPVPAWKFRAVLGASLVFGLVSVAAVPRLRSNASSQIPPKRVRVPVQAAEIDIQPVEEALVHDLLPRMLRNELPAKQERNLMWHMLVCRGCFDEYVELKHQHPVSQQPGATLAIYRR